MAKDDPGLFDRELASFNAQTAARAAAQLTALVRPDDLIGDLFRIDYASSEVVVHDHARQKVGGLPLGCFLLATRLAPGAAPPPMDEDTCLVLLRVTGQSRLPNASEADLSRFQASQRVASSEDHWDAEGKTDKFTMHQLRYAGVSCRVLGTFRMRAEAPAKWRLVFGADLSNFYAGRGMKVYKPVGESLSAIVNFAKGATSDDHPLRGHRVPVGRVRYASSERVVDGPESVAVELDPTDLVARRTALFGMSRTGKSNTTKVIAASVFRLREQGARVGQLVFDVNGEYANENAQDDGALKGVAEHTPGAATGDVSTYGMTGHPNDPGRRIVKINFHGGRPGNWEIAEDVARALEPLLVGKQLIDGLLAEQTAKYVQNFRNTSLDLPAILDRSSATRYRRAVFVYRTALHAAGFAVPSPGTFSIKSLFNRDLVTAMGGSTSNDAPLYARAAAILAKDTISGDEAVEVSQALRRFIHDAQASGYAAFNAAYGSSREGRAWHDDRLTGLLSLFEYPNGVRGLRPLLIQHDPASVGDYAEAIIDDLHAGKLVIFDQSTGNPDLNRSAAERIMWALFNRQKAAFVNPARTANGTLEQPRDVLVYAEEAHNLLPPGSAIDTQNIWSRVAKEGSKYRIGLVYATQEPSSIQSNIMKNTDNWFVAHLNNTDETKELRKYYDFADFETSILQVPDPGFIRMRTLSNPYIVPIQVDRFRVAP